MDHSSGYSCWDFDACSISVFTMEGKSHLTLDFCDRNFISGFLKRKSTPIVYTFFFIAAFPLHFTMKHTYSKCEDYILNI